jgi:hypothetical protein
MPPEPTPQPPAPTPPAPEVTTQPEHRSFWRDPVGGSLLGVGLGAVVVGAALWGVGNARIDDANASSSYEQALGRIDSAQSARGLQIGGIVTFSAGFALVLGAVGRYAYVARRGSR